MNSPCERVCWTLEAARFSSVQMTIVSQQFVINTCPFKFIIVPCLSEKVLQASKNKIRPTFQAADSVVAIQMKCEGKPAPKMTIKFFVSNAAPRGPITHDFKDKNVTQLPVDQLKWNMKEYLQPGDKTVTIGVECTILDPRR
jgi:hypothetical protein